MNSSIPGRPGPPLAIPVSTNLEQGRRLSEGAGDGSGGSQPPASNALLADLAERRPASRDKTGVLHPGMHQNVVPVKSADPRSLSNIHDDAKLMIAAEVLKSSESAAIALCSLSRSWRGALLQRFEYALLQDARAAVVNSGPRESIRMRWFPVFLPGDEQDKIISSVIEDYEQGGPVGKLCYLGRYAAQMSEDQLNRFIDAATCSEERRAQDWEAASVIAAMPHLTRRQRWAMVRYTVAEISRNGPWLVGKLAKQMEHLSPGQVRYLFEAVLGIGNRWVRAYVLVKLGFGARYLSENQCIQALEHLFGMGDAAPLLAARFAAHGAPLSHAQCEHVVDICTSIASEEGRAETLAEFGTGLFRFSEDQRQRLLDSAASISDPVLKLLTMRGLAAGMEHLTREQRKMVLDAILDAEHGTVDQWKQTKGIIACVETMEYLNTDKQEEQSVPDEQTRVVAAAVKLPAALEKVWPHMAHLNDENLKLVVAATAAMIEHAEAVELDEIAPAVEYLSHGQRELLIARIANFDDDFEKAHVLRTFKPAMAHLSAEQRQRIREIALAMQDKRCRADALVGLAIGDRA